MAAKSKVTLTLSRSATTVPVYVYAYQWPIGTYTFNGPNAVTIESGAPAATKIVGKKTLKVVGGVWSGILKFPGGSTQLGWIGNPKNKNAHLTFTLAWVKN